MNYIQQKTSSIYKFLVVSYMNDWIFLTTAATFLLLSLSLTLRRLYSFGNGYDFSVFTQALWQVSHGQNLHSTLTGTPNIFGNHFHPIILLLAPFSAIIDTKLVLVVAQCLLVTLSALPIYLFAKKRFSKSISSLLVGIYLFGVSIQYMVFFEFHEIAFALPLLGCLIYFSDTNRWKAFLITLPILLLTREDMGMLCFLLGVIIFIRHRKIGAITLAVSLAYFLLINGLVVPFLNRNTPYIGFWAANYSEFGATPRAGLHNLLHHPFSMIKIGLSELVTPQVKVNTILTILAPLLYILPFFSPYFILTIPLFILRFWGDYPQYWDINLHYNAVPWLILILSFTDSLHRLKVYISGKIPKMSSSYPKVLKAILIISLLVTLKQSANLGSPFYAYFNTPANLVNVKYIFDNNYINEYSAVERTLITTVGSSSVTVNIPLLPILAERNEVYELVPSLWWTRPGEPTLEIVREPNTKYIVINKSLEIKYNGRSSLKNLTNDEHIYISHGYRKIRDDDVWLIYQR